MTTEYSARFVKDLKALRGTPAFAKIRALAFESVPEMDAIDQIPHCAKLEGHENYYRIRVGDYRIGAENVRRCMFWCLCASCTGKRFTGISRRG